MFAGPKRNLIVLSAVAAVWIVPEQAGAAGAAYVVDTAEVGEPGACKVEIVGFGRQQSRFFRGDSPSLRGRHIQAGGVECPVHTHARRR